MGTQTIEQFFTGKTLVIPAYQRDYAWTTSNIDDLFEDIEEAMELGGGHYLGTFILSQTAKNAPVNVVDGQQRLTTLTILLDALVDAVDEPEIKNHYRSTYINHPVYGPKFNVLGSNKSFFTDLLNNENPVPNSDGQERLLSAHQWIRQRVANIKSQKGQTAIKEWLLSISHLEVLDFTESNEGKAIRMFQSVNDRGVPLAKMDIAKSLLIYYSNRFLDGKLDSFIAEKFGDAFRCFSKIKKLAGQNGYQIRLINRDPFKEDDILRYHYFAFNADVHGVDAGSDYNATSETVLETFLKPSLKSMRGDKERLKGFILDYVEDIASFFRGLLEIIELLRNDRALYMLFVVQDLSSTLYPLIIRLHLARMLDEKVPTYLNRSLLELVEMADLRVFKLQGTNPQADMATLIRSFSKLDVDGVAERLVNFCQRFMPSSKFESRLAEEDIYRNLGLLRILLEAEDQARVDAGAQELQILELVNLISASVTIEHILPQEPSFGVESYGFQNAESYVEHIHLLGNLVPLEKKINSACNNLSVEHKMREEKLYRSSGMYLVKNIASISAGKTPAFSKEIMLKRSEELARFAVRAWPISIADIME